MLRIRLFSPTDVRMVSNLVRMALGENYPPSLFFDLHQWWREGFVVAENSNQVIGFIAGVASSPEQARVLMLAVDVPYRNQGIGTQLMTYFERHCAIRGMKRIELEVRQSNKSAITFYRRLGYELSQSLKSFYTDGEDGYKMIKML